MKCEMAENIAKRKSKKRYLWRPHAEKLIIEVWADKIHQLRVPRKNGQTFREMASILAKRDVKVTAEEIQTKIHNMTKRYRLEKGKIRHSGGSTWENFNKVNEILGNLKINNVANPIEDSLLYESLSEQSISNIFCESLPLLPPTPPSMPEPSIPAPSCSSDIDISIPANKSNPNKIAKVLKSMETALEEQHRVLEKMADDIREFDERNFRLLSRLVESTTETNDAMRNYFN